MAINAAQLEIAVTATGTNDAAQKILSVSRAGKDVADKTANASRAMTRFGAAAAQAGQIGATGLSGIAQQAADIAFGFGPTGAVVGAVATAGIAISAVFFKAQQEAEKFRAELARLVFDSNFAGAFAKQRDIEFQIEEAQKRVAKANAMTGASVEAIVLKKQEQWKAERALKELEDQHVEAVKVTQKLAVEVGERQATGLKLQQEQATQAEREAAAQKAAAQAIRDKAAAHKASADAQAALAKASEGITLTGPAVDLGTGDLSRAPTIPVQVAPIFSVDNASILALQEQIKDILESEFNNRQLGVALQFAEFGQNVTESLANSLGEAAGHGFKNAGGIVLGALGGVFKMMGSALISFGATMVKLLPALSNPFTSGPAALIAGAALVAVGTALSGLATGAGGGGGGGGYSPAIGSVTNPAHVTNVTIGGSGTQGTAAGITPMQPVTFNVFGENDPVAQRVLVNTLDNARRRGL